MPLFVHKYLNLKFYIINLFLYNSRNNDKIIEKFL